MNGYNYVITTGWWCEGYDNPKNRNDYFGDQKIRVPNFHKYWYEAIDRFTSPEKLLIVDSNSPIPPPYSRDDTRVEYVKLAKNSGHATTHTGKFCGFTQGYLEGLTYAIANEFDYWVYIEQDVLVFGEDIVEECIKMMNKPFMFGAGTGTPQPIQQSFMIIRKDGFIPYLTRLIAIESRDCEMSPEIKTLIASSGWLSRLPEFLFRETTSRRYNEFRKKIIGWLAKSTLLSGHDELPCGFGRARPLDFSAERFYFQHGLSSELQLFEEKIKGH